MNNLSIAKAVTLPLVRGAWIWSGDISPGGSAAHTKNSNMDDKVAVAIVKRWPIGTFILGFPTSSQETPTP